MKKTFTAMVLASLSFCAVAQQSGFISSDTQGNTQGGFTGQKPGLTSVAQAKNLRDDTWVIFEGKIVKQVGHELYEFRDSSGTIHVDIDDKDWMGQTASPNDKVRIEGEIDKDWNRIEIDVKNLSVLK
ncbi:YgiW/YdeI family stress tolerance OB fold protein [Serratia sp. UGAL515B_01]|uniref:YgiW/YdeI family stress tolerance OB fold protein n=1 Tax=Serratia sp. UGAL515B_01 TaxID=2986763 RepID=UPI00295331BE|nr:YgiW/YdeI family stress tolerance OB fold protein [Serratia sp. UGAL515B_01]WON76499.1 YgiW/YdeI family stress tolerance OB fold protein [Serratia sp. UGAL515B_01]